MSRIWVPVNKHLPNASEVDYFWHDPSAHDKRSRSDLVIAIDIYRNYYLGFFYCNTLNKHDYYRGYPFDDKIDAYWSFYAATPPNTSAETLYGNGIYISNEITHWTPLDVLPELPKKEEEK